MDILKWQNIIIEWINCLKLVKPVVVINELKDGEFFNELLIRLSKKDRTISTDTTTHISDFLKKHYPAFFLENESTEIHDSVEITYAYSLLLHYCSLVDCSEQFILPLCKDLNYVSQIFVKNFLEDLQLSSVITRDILKNAIHKMNKFASTPTKSVVQFGSPKTPTNTPLLEYLKTPYKKMTEEIHKREIKQMQAQLDLERFEKADLQEELCSQYEKNKKLDKNISENQIEIRRLRAKVLSLENFTPPSNSRQDKNIENKRLRDEIVSLEKYVEILHKEQEELQTERDKARDKLRKMEETHNDWQTKYMTNEKQLFKLTEENKNYLQELLYLRERCDELSTMVHELNPKKCYDDSYESDLVLYDYNKSGSVVDSASLAQTVVDVQLVDAQTENRNLRTQLGEFEQTTEKLTSQLNEMMSEMAKLQAVTKETQIKLANTKTELQTTLELLSLKTEENDHSNTIITELKQKTSDLEHSLNFTQKQKNNLIDELKVTTEMNKTFIETLNSEIKNLIAEKESLNEKLAEITQKAENCESSNEILKNKFEQFNLDLESCLIKFKNNLNYDDEFPDDSDLISKLSTLIDAFEMKHSNNSKMIYELEDLYQSLIVQITKLEEEITTLSLNEVERKREVDHLKICLKTAQTKIEHYEKEVVTNYESLIDKYKSIIEEKCGMISELTKLKDVLINKDNVIMKLQNEQQDLQNELTNEKKIQNNLKNVVNEKDNFIKSLELEKDNFDLLNKRLSTELSSLKKLAQENDIKLETLEQEKKYLKDETTQLHSDKTELNMKCQHLNDVICEKISQIEEVNTQNQNYAKNIETLKEEICVLQNSLKTLETNCENLQKNIKKKTSQKKNLQTELEEITNKLTDAESLKIKFEFLYNQTKQTVNEKVNYINGLNNQKHELENQIDGLTNQLKTLEEDLSQEKQLKDELNNDLKHVREELTNEKCIKNDLNDEFIISKQNYETEIKHLCDLIETKTLEIVSLQKKIGTLNENIESVNREVFNITNMLDAENKNIQQKEQTVENLNSHLTNLKSQLSITLEEKKETMEEVKSYKQKIDFYKREFETYKHELENVFDEINSHLIEQMNLKNVEINDEMPILETLKEVLHAEHQKDKEILGDMLHKIIELKRNIYNLVVENHRVSGEMNTLQKQYHILDDLKTDMELKLTDVTEHSTNMIVELNDQLEETRAENLKYISNLETYRDNLSKAHETFAETQISVDGLIKKHKMETDNYNESISELKRKNKKLEEQVHQLKISEKTLTEELYGQQNKLQNLLKDYDTTVKQKEDIKHKKETLCKKLIKETENVEELQGSLSKTNLKLEASLREIDMYKSLKAEFEKSFTALNKDREDVVNNYEAKLKKMKQENVELKEQAEELITEVRKIKDVLNIEKTKQIDLDTRMKNFTVETEKLEENVLTLTSKLETTEEERKSLTVLNEELNNMIHQSKVNHKEEIEKLQLDINKLNIEIKVNQKQIQTYEIEKIEFEKLRENNLHLQQKIDDLNDDKIVLSQKVEQLNEDLVKLKSCCDEKYKEKLEEINDTKTKLSYTLSLIDNIYKLLETELHKTSIELKQSDVTEKDVNLCNKIENEILNLKTSIELLLEKKNKLNVDLENITIKVSEIEEKSSQDKLIYEQKYEEMMTENKEKLNTLRTQNNEMIEALEKRLKKEEKTSQIYLQEVELLNTKLIDKLEEIEKVTNEKQSLIKEYKTIASKLSLLKQSRNDLAEDYRKIVKEVETYIIKTHESVNNIKQDFTHRLEIHEKQHETDELLVKQLENFLQVEKNNVSFLEDRVKDLITEKNQLITITSKSFTNIHEFYNKIFDDSDVTQQINKIKQNQSEIEDKLQSINFEQEIVDKEIELINNELTDLRKMREEMANYELVKSDYVTLKNKYNLMSVCETENNGYKLKISDLENKLTDLQSENVKYQKEITELQKEHNNVIDEHNKDINLIETSYTNWKKMAEDKNAEIDVLIEKYATEIKEISDSNIQLHKIIKELEDKLYLNEELIYQEKCKNDDLTNTNSKLEKELDKQIQSNEKLLADGKTDYDIMNQKYELLSRKIPNLEDEILCLQGKIAKYKNIVTEMEQDNLNLNKNYAELKHQYKMLCEQDADKVDKEVVKLRASYATLVGENTRLQLDCNVLKKTIEERNSQLSELSFMKESYEKLLEDNNKALMELDTLRYKRNRDKEEFKRLLEEERTKGTTNADSQITDIRNEYEEKLKKMKEKMVNLYKEEMEREKKRITLKLSQSEEIVQSLKSQLWVTGNKNVNLTKEIEKLREQLRSMKEKLNFNDDFRGSRDSVSSLKEKRAICDVEERRISTLPRDSRSFQRPQVNIIEETITVSRKRRSITGGVSNLDQGLKMEDEEGELFNNTYLSDLKAGKCVEGGRESVSSRLSELQYRNSLCPPHLKSSYPAETQFQSPGQFKEEDLKMGTVDLDDSMSSSLLPGEKPRMKKDWGQTMYKKPGPPTPSKNGGRLSLQGSEVHPRDVLREQNENKQGARSTSTPSRIKMLFSRSGASHRNDSEVGTKVRCLHHSYEHSLVPLLTRPEPVRLSPQLIKVYHIPHTFGQAFRYYCSKNVIHAFLLMIASAFTTYLSLYYYFDM